MRYAFFLAVVGLLTAPPAQSAQKDYNGRWTITGTTERGQCVRGFRINIRIYRGKAYIIGRSLNGTKTAIGSRGQVSVTYVDGTDVITARGMLKKRSGAGRWSFPTYRCTGRWQAKRR